MKSYGRPRCGRAPPAAGGPGPGRRRIAVTQCIGGTPRGAVCRARPTAARLRRACAAAALALLAAAACPARADKLVLKTGRTFEGRLVRHDPDRVVFEIHMDGMVLKATYPADRVAAVRRARLYADTLYYVVPIRGRIGEEVNADVLKRCLDLAADNVVGEVPDAVLLDISSPGGELTELMRLLGALRAYPSLRIVAYVRSAASAAAVLAMGCREIVVAPGASIGGAVIYRRTPWGTPANIEEKMQSFWRATFRAVAARAGHDPLLMEGMMRTDLVLSTVTTSDGRPKVVEGGAGRPLKPAGRILTLSADEAVACGLALGVADRPVDCNRLLGLGQWQELMPRAAANLFDAWRQRAAEARRRYRRLFDKAVALYDEAMAEHPGQFEYTVDGQTGLFVPASKARWRRQSDRCCDALRRAEDCLDRADRIREAHPRLRLATGFVEDLRAKCVRLREAVEADYDRPDRPDPSVAEKRAGGK